MLTLNHHKPALQPEAEVLFLLHSIYFCYLFTMPWGWCLWLYNKSDQSKWFLVAISWVVLNQVISKILLLAELRKTHSWWWLQEGQGKAELLLGMQWQLLLAYREPTNSTWLLGTFCLVVGTLTPKQLNPALEAKRPGLSAACWTDTRCQPDGHTAWAEPLAPSSRFLFTKHFLSSSQQHFEQLIYILGNNYSLLALNKPLCLAETRECNMSFTKLPQDSRDRLQKYALYSVKRVRWQHKDYALHLHAEWSHLETWQIALEN